MVDLLPDARRRRRSIGLFALALFVVAQIALVAGFPAIPIGDWLQDAVL